MSKVLYIDFEMSRASTCLGLRYRTSRFGFSPASRKARYLSNWQESRSHSATSFIGYRSREADPTP
jgi:hypothetical protein